MSAPDRKEREMSDGHFTQVGKGIFAWVMACGFAAFLSTGFMLIELVVAQPSMAFYLVIASVYAWFVIMIVTAVPGFALVMVARIAGIPRPLADIALPASVTLVITILFLATTTNDSSLRWAPVALAFVAGLSGAVFWYFAGRPRPPYARP